MSNSYVRTVKGLYSGIFADIRAALPTVVGLDRDEHRILSQIDTRGLRFTTLDLPSYGKHFDRCLADGQLTASGIPNFGCRGGRSSPQFLKGLISRVFNNDGVLLSQPCPNAVLFLRQIFFAVKKISINCTENVRENALKRYIGLERSLREPTLNWGGRCLDHGGGVRLSFDDVHHWDYEDANLPVRAASVTKSLCDTVHEISDRVFSSFGVFDASEWKPKHGPGAVADARAGKFKYDFPTWNDRLEGVFPQADLAYANYAVWADSLRAGACPSNHEVPATVLTVPKSQKTPRLIAKEPVANMWCQQIVRDYLETNVRSGVLGDVIHFGDQTFNRDAALQASCTQTHWTVDLSDASDRVSLWLVERMVRSNKTLLNALHASRSLSVDVPLGDGVNLYMRKFAPQGSATTFPLQSIIYAIIAIASVIHSRGLAVTTRSIKRVCEEVLVFGDDTIIPADSGETYVDLLAYLGFFVNPDKTFRTGKFRESCGCEAYDGADVTPAYFVTPYKESAPSSIASVVECSNNFYLKGFWHTANALQTTLPDWVQRNTQVRRVGDGRFGFRSYGTSLSRGKTRYNRDLHRHEIRATTITTSVTRTQPGGYGHLLQYFTETPALDILWMSGVDGRSVDSAKLRWEPAG